ncbi:hypothetical protein HOY80DRAFT_979763 [Tuber brumale]|nr:hypothetical protein HOY80DRAFT_979763 [Tuber brumale]
MASSGIKNTMGSILLLPTLSSFIAPPRLEALALLKMPTWFGFMNYKLVSIMTGLDVVFTIYLFFGKGVFRPYLRVDAMNFPVLGCE